MLFWHLWFIRKHATNNKYVCQYEAGKTNKMDTIINGQLCQSMKSLWISLFSCALHEEYQSHKISQSLGHKDQNLESSWKQERSILNV